MKVLILLTVTILLVSVQASNNAIQPLDPEQVLFHLSRCIEIYADLLEGKAREQAIQKWKSYDLKGGSNDNTECYVQCGLERLGLFNSESGKLQPEQIDEQFNEFGDIVGVSSEGKNKLKNAFSAISKKSYGNCKELHSAYLQKIHSNKELLQIFRKLYHDKDLAQKVYDDLAAKGKPIRARNQSYFEYCEKQHYKDENAALCEVRQYKIDEQNLDRFKSHTECIFKGLRYINCTDSFNASEIIRDFQLVKKTTFNDQIKKCVAKQDVLDVYKCFVQGDPQFVAAFKEAFDYREIRSKYYGFRLKYPKYVREQVEQQVDNIDNDICK